MRRKKITWQNTAVHEQLTMNSATVVSLLKGYILHCTVASIEEYNNKTIAYAKLNAEKYFAQGKRGSLLKEWFSPIFSKLK